MKRDVLELIRASVIAFVGECEFGGGREHRSGATNDDRLQRLLDIIDRSDSEPSRDWSDADCSAWCAAGFLRR